MRLDDEQDDKSSSEHLEEEESDLSRIEHGASLTKVAFTVHRTPWKSDRFIAKRTTSYQSPLDVSQALDETEALVRSLVAKWSRYQYWLTSSYIATFQIFKRI